ncbi:MAG: hypothetical protein ABI475_03750 [Methylophilaceae bacterium]
MDPSQTSLLLGSAIIALGQAAYVKLPADIVLKLVDNKFPMFKECVDADFIKGGGHRWKGGHDLLHDVPQTLMDHGPIRAFNHAAHIVLTDLPTKAGIPIPALSGSSELGHWLRHDVGIHKGYLTMHWADTGVGFLAIAEGATDIIQALNGLLPMDQMVFFDTFIEGSLECAFPVVQQWLIHSSSAFGIINFNPVFVTVTGVENILAGIISAYQTVSVYVDPLFFFSSAGTSALIGFGLAYGLAGQTLSDAAINATRSGVIGAFFSLSPAFGYGVLAGFVSFKLGGKLAEIHNTSTRALLAIDENAYRQLLDEMCKGNVHLAEFLDRAETHITLSDNAPTFSTQADILDDVTQIFSDSGLLLESCERTLLESNKQLMSDARTLPVDNPILTDWYRAVLAR